MAASLKAKSVTPASACCNPSSWHCANCLGSSKCPRACCLRSPSSQSLMAASVLAMAQGTQATCCLAAKWPKANTFAWLVSQVLVEAPLLMPVRAHRAGLCRLPMFFCPTCTEVLVGCLQLLLQLLLSPSAGRCTLLYLVILLSCLQHRISSQGKAIQHRMSSPDVPSSVSSAIGFSSVAAHAA